MKLALIARMDKSGLGNQTKNLARLLNPHKIILIDSTSFNGRNQYPEIYKNYKNIQIIDGFVQDHQIDAVLSDVEAVLTCETFYNHNIPIEAEKRGIRTYNQANWEFLDNLRSPRIPQPTKFLWPSYWYLETATREFRNKVLYLPPPIFEEDFKRAREINFSRSGKLRLLHSVGRQAIHDRAGTQDLLDSLRFTTADFELVIKMQSDGNLTINDPRVTIDTSSPDNEADIYTDFDAMIQPRRYGGLNLPMNEALASGLPVIMTDVSPNNRVLPPEWLIRSDPKATFMTRTRITAYSANHYSLADKISWLCNISIDNHKKTAYNIYQDNYSPEKLLPRYEEILYG